MDIAASALLIVNVASRCGFTPQYEGLEALYRKHKDKGFVVLGFPCNQFGRQEPGSEAEIRGFCDRHYSVTFPLFAKIDVNGPNAHPLYRYLKSAKKGLLGRETIAWNFTKFLVGKNGASAATIRPSPHTGSDRQRCGGPCLISSASSGRSTYICSISCCADAFGPGCACWMRRAAGAEISSTSCSQASRSLRPMPTLTLSTPFGGSPLSWRRSYRRRISAKSRSSG